MWGKTRAGLEKPRGVFNFDHFFHHDGIYFFSHNYICFAPLCLYLCNLVVLSLFTGGLKPLNRFKPSSKIFYWPFQGGTSFVDLLCFCSVLCLLCLCASVYMCFVVTCWERADLLALVCGVFCEFVTFPLVSWVRRGTWLYRFLIFATLLLLHH